MDLFNCKSITINNKDVKEISINNKIVWEKIREKRRLINGENFNLLVKSINYSDPTTDTEDNYIKKVVFDYWKPSYLALLGNFTTGTDVSYANDGSIRLFFNNEIIYVLSYFTISLYDGTTMLKKFKALEEVDFINFDTANNTSFNAFMFESNMISKQIGMENFDTSNCTSMENMLNSAAFNKIGQDDTCDLNVSTWDTSKSTSFRQMFRNCTATLIDIRNFTSPLATRFQGMFSGCTNLVTLDMRNIDFSLITLSEGSTAISASDILQNCTSLENLNFGKNLGTGYVSSGSGYAGSLDIGRSIKLTHDSLMSIINNVGTFNFVTNRYVIYYGPFNYGRVTAEERAIAISKGWMESNSYRN